MLAGIVATRTAVVPVAGRVRNLNRLLGSDQIVGLKTGSTPAVGGCVLLAAWHRVSGRRTLIIAAVFGQPGALSASLANALAAGQQLILAVDHALDHPARARSALGWKATRWLLWSLPAWPRRTPGYRHPALVFVAKRPASSPGGRRLQVSCGYGLGAPGFPTGRRVAARRRWVWLAGHNARSDDLPVRGGGGSPAG